MSKKSKSPAAKQSPAKKETAAKESPAKKAVEKKGGVIASIIEFLTAASASKPLSKKSLVAKLKERFPDREELALSRTINCQVPTRLRKDKELDVKKNDEGYWLK